MGLAPIRLGKRDQAQELRSREADGGKLHPYLNNYTCATSGVVLTEK